MTSTGVPLGLSWSSDTAANWSAGVRPLEPFLAFNFAVEFEGLLAGGFSDGDRQYQRGDFSFSDGEIDHSPVADDDGECLCLTVTDAPLRLTGPLMRLLNPFIRF